MKVYFKYIVPLLVAVSAAFAACTDYGADGHKFDNAVYLDVSRTGEVRPATFNNNLPSLEWPLQATLIYPSDREVTVSLAIDPSLVAVYNTRFGTSWPMLDAKYYEFSAQQATIPAGKLTSDVVTLRLRELMGEGGEQIGALPIDETYLLPVRITGSSLPALDGSSIAYYVVKRSSAINTVAQLTDNWIYFESLDKYGEGSMVFNGLRAVTYEAWIYINEFLPAPTEISSIMGVEQYLLLRLGDTNFERGQLQFDGSGSGSAFGKFPVRDAAKNLVTNRWYHVACTYDQAARTVRIYLDGKLQSETTGVGVLVPDAKNGINLAMRALYDLWNTAPAADKPNYETPDTGYDKLGNAYQFFIGYSYNETRPLNGRIAEARVWSVARTPEQIWENMYNVGNPESDPTLIGYWKFNEGHGNEIKDYSRYGNHGKAQYDIVWPEGVEIPVINQEED